MRPVPPRQLAALLALAAPLAALLALPALEEARAGEGRDRDAGTGTITNAVGMKLVPVPAGKFTMGSPKSEAERGEDEAQHEVEISRPYHMGAFLVTQEEYAKVMGKNGSWFSRNGSSRQKVQGMDTGRFPVDNVSWRDAQQFCERLSELDRKDGKARTYRLPTEAEWEYAGREAGKASTPFHFGASLGSAQANFDGRFPYGGADRGPYLARPCPVGSYRPNALGLYDVHGNLWQWCRDWYGKDYYKTSPAKDPQGPERGTTRVLRGGCWCYNGRECRSAYRGNEAPSFQDGTIGFRVVCVSAD
jgi:formylglycine-generating enzyme required for sulfatase activity